MVGDYKSLASLTEDISDLEDKRRSLKRTIRVTQRELEEVEALIKVLRIEQKNLTLGGE